MSSSKIFVFGANGMVGSYVHKYFKGSIPVTRNNVDARQCVTLIQTPILDKLGIGKGDVVINLMEITNKRKETEQDFYLVNATFPHLLADYCELKGVKMIHISTDCVFDGAKGNYSESERFTAKDIYGISKFLGEPPNCTVIRTSVIGENRNSDKDLLEWVRSHKNTDITGYTNHYWNGITCLQFAKVCEIIINDNRFWRGVRHIHSPYPVSKSWILEQVDRIYELHNNIHYKMTDTMCDRTLRSDYSFDWADIPDTGKQIYEQKDWLYKE